MKRIDLTCLRRFATGEEGSVAPAVALWMPVFMLLIVSTIELGTVTIRQTVLERALDQTVREVKIGIGPSTHDQMKEAICERAAILPSCLSTLRLEMVPLDVLSWVEPTSNVDCVDTSQPVTPQLDFNVGVGGQMMLLRACYKFRPVTPIGGLNAALGKDDQGYASLLSSTAFVHEPG